ncbi:hypothetical protein PR003_g18543 [Phytophthora rubi]|nr:hypothetical protein PR002_g17862 [Phytophthora rubi]KAE9317166.1 hypothetical protein PR003_g18543 [Phytophthora rubi]
MESENALPLHAAVRIVSRECFPSSEFLPHVEELIDGFIDDFPGQKAFYAACGRGASERALEYLLGRAAPDWNETTRSVARGGHLHVLQWMVVKRQDRRGPWRVDFNGALAEAAAQGHLETAKWLYKYESSEPSRGKALGDAAANGHLAVVQWLWGQGVRDRQSISLQQTGIYK